MTYLLKDLQEYYELPVKGTMRLLFKEFTMSVQPQLAEVRYLGIDELYLLNQYLCVITDVGNRHIIDLLRGRHKESLEII